MCIGVARDCSKKTLHLLSQNNTEDRRCSFKRTRSWRLIIGIDMYWLVFWINWKKSEFSINIGGYLLDYEYEDDYVP